MRRKISEKDAKTHKHQIIMGDFNNDVREREFRALTKDDKVQLRLRSFFCISRPRDPSNPIQAELSSSFAHGMLQMVEYEPENDLVPLDFRILTYPVCFRSF